jgi:hypothetical protein
MSFTRQRFVAVAQLNVFETGYNSRLLNRLSFEYS